jgi:hypothetical protein
VHGQRGSTFQKRQDLAGDAWQGSAQKEKGLREKLIRVVNPSRMNQMLAVSLRMGFDLES